MQQGFHLLEQRVDVYQVAFRLDGRHEAFQPVDDRPGPQRLPIDVFHGTNQIRRRDLILASQFDTRARIICDRTQGLVDLVGQPSGHFTHAAQAVEVSELGNELLCMPAGTLALSHVADDHHGLVEPKAHEPGLVELLTIGRIQ